MNSDQQKNESVMVSEEIFEVTEREVEEMLTGIWDDSDSSSERRIESIMKQVKLEAVIKGSVDVMAEGIPGGLKGIVDAVKGIAKKDSDPPKRSY